MAMRLQYGRFLLKAKGVQIDAKGKNGVTALMLASVNGHHDVVQTLLKAEQKKTLAKATQFAMGAIDLFQEKSSNLNMYAGFLISCSVTLVFP
jgi:ankyrin repeat protein